jgi:CRISPR-associated protein Cmr6
VKYPVPKSTAEAWETYRAAPHHGANPGLIFDRFADPDKKHRNSVLNEVRQAAGKADRDLLRAWQGRWECAAQAVQAEPFTLRTDWRFVTGLGRKGGLETGFTFHRYGFPYLPGSSVKGVAHAWATLVGGLADDHPDMMAIFGYVPPPGVGDPPARCGRAVFLDAIPAGDALPELVIDIMNPHYADYYQGKAAPTDWQSPVPITFLTVKERTAFRFAVGWRGRLDEEGRRRHQQAVEWLQRGLSELGAGAKTSAGYGYFVVPPEAARRGAAAATMPTTARVQTATPPTAPPTQEPAAPIVSRRGTIVEIRPDKRRGRLRDQETGEEYTFSTSVIVGDTPAKKAPVIFNLQGDQVVEVRRA